MTTELTINGIPLQKSFTFPGGEIQIQLPNLPIIKHNIVNIKTRLNSSAKIIELLLVKDALMHYYPTVDVNLEVLYFPYARQDRRCASGESYSLQVITNIINKANFASILIADAHSNKVTALLKNVTELKAADIFKLRKTDTKFNLVIAPDEGAENRAKHIANDLNKKCIQANKMRCTNTGKIKSISLPSFNNAYIHSSDVLIVDDICDGGGTFIALLDSVMSAKPNSVTLYVTHGLFSKGVGILFEAGIDRIITTNSVYSGSDPRVEVIEL